ncbi:MAG: ABC transporter ATP-binding protein [Dehalococcoidia bacterium]
MLLSVMGVNKRFGGVEALKDVEFQVEEGDLVGILGPNGAGKSTLFDVLSGVIRPSSGKILFRGEDIVGLKPHQIVQRGLIRTFQANRLFRSTSVLGNVEISCHNGGRASMFAGVIGHLSERQRSGEAKKRAEDIIRLMGLEAVTGELARNLPHGYQRALGVAIALGPEPRLLCLDEPLTGMNIDEVRFMTDLINRLRGEGITILLVEHHVRAVMEICGRIIVLNFGKKIAEGTVDQIRSNKNVIEAYLGKDQEYAA